MELKNNVLLGPILLGFGIEIKISLISSEYLEMLSVEYGIIIIPSKNVITVICEKERKLANPTNNPNIEKGRMDNGITISTTAILIFLGKSDGSGIKESTDTKEKIAMMRIPDMTRRMLDSRYPEMEFMIKSAKKNARACPGTPTSPRGTKNSTYPITSTEYENSTNRASNGNESADEFWWNLSANMEILDDL